VGRSRAGLAPNLLRVGATSAERLWARTEDRLDEATKTACRDGVGASPLSLGWLRKGVALHFARSKVTVELLDGLWSERGPRLIEGIVQRNRTLLTAHFIAHHDRRPSLRDLENLVAAYTADGTHLNTTGAWTRARVERVFADLNSADRIRRRVILERPAPGSEFLIADNPVTTHRYATGEVATARRIGWDTADEIVMPFAPNLAVCLVADDIACATKAVPVEEVVASEERTRQLNARQVRAARDYLFHRPSYDVSAQAAEALGR